MIKCADRIGIWEWNSISLGVLLRRWFCLLLLAVKPSCFNTHHGGETPIWNGQDPYKVPRSCFVGVAGNVFPPLRDTNSKTTHYLLSYFSGSNIPWKVPQKLPLWTFWGRPRRCQNHVFDPYKVWQATLSLLHGSVPPHPPNSRPEHCMTNHNACGP